MLAKRREILLRYAPLQRTPLLIPSFSSKVPNANKILRATEEVIDGPILVSAYDISYGLIKPPFDFASIVFLDSGGYEASKDVDLTAIDDAAPQPRDWSREAHETVLAGWNVNVATVFISYDHPKERLSVADQIARARAMAPDKADVVRELLLKPETVDQTLVHIESVVKYVHDLADFDIIGVTEKEIGHSILDRMTNIAKLRIALDRAGLDKPIHVFGSLDTITTPMYFLAGADIFDGLTWLRYAYYDGYTLYRYNFGALDFGINTKSRIVDARCWSHNYRYLVDLQLDLSRFLKDHDFACFRKHADCFRRASEATEEAVLE